MAENLGWTPRSSTSTWGRFRRSSEGYTHIGISFIVPNVFKARRMALYSASATRR
jgi:hypothetical protein